MSWENIDPTENLQALVTERGGWVNAHAHIDRSYIINADNWQHINADLQTKWDLTDDFKRSASVEQILGRMCRVVEDHLDRQGAQALGSFLDCDSVVRDKSLQAADQLRERYGRDIQLVFMSQPIKGLVDETERRWFEESAEFVDIIGGLPERDSHSDPEFDRSEDHMDTIFGLARQHDKPVHIHIDQLNSPDQTDTALAVTKTNEYDYAGRVTLIHCISLAAQPEPYRQHIYQELAAHDISVVSCPVAWIDSRRNETLAPTHNALTPVDELVPAGVTVALGTDNIADIYKPFGTGDMATELKFLLETSHLYDLDKLADIATTNGLKVLGLSPANAAATPATPELYDQQAV